MPARSRAPQPSPTETLPKGFAAAEKVVKQACRSNPELGPRVVAHLKTAGFQGAPALTYLAECVIWRVRRTATVPTHTGSLKLWEAQAIEARAADIANELGGQA